MPQRLTAEWRNSLGGDADEVHGVYCNRLANLTLSGDDTNSGLGAKTFEAKRAVYRESPIGLTNRIACEVEWDESAMERRAEDLAQRVLRRWPWNAGKTRQTVQQGEAAPLRWRIGAGGWHSERVASRMVLNVAGALLDLNPTNAQALAGKAVGPNVHLASLYPADKKVGARTMRAIPGHEDYVLSPYARDYRRSAEKCRKMGLRCGVDVQVDVAQEPTFQAFWKVLKAMAGGVPGQGAQWLGPWQWTSAMNQHGDRIALNLTKGGRVWLHVRAGERQPSERRKARMRALSLNIQDQMSDQSLGDDLEKRAAAGATIAVERNWEHDDEEAWPEVAQWMKDQQVRLEAILTKLEGVTE